ncbi:MAG: hypothetical protein GW810_12835, partial [Flavobacteriales bacterium]|nr:hypothetical protein [Flavobacteriales bacterium]
MKKKLLLVVFFTSACVFSQQKKFTVDWNGFQTLSAQTFSVNVPSFNRENFSFSYEEGLQFVSQWKSSEFIDETKVNLTNVT